MKVISKLTSKLSVDRYYRMSNAELEEEAGKFRIGEYFDGHVISRQIIIKQLLEKDMANNSRIAIIISIVAIVISIGSLFM